jgi:hypothetical protein
MCRFGSVDLCTYLHNYMCTRAYSQLYAGNCVGTKQVLTACHQVTKHHRHVQLPTAARLPPIRASLTMRRDQGKPPELQPADKAISRAERPVCEDLPPGASCGITHVTLLELLLCSNSTRHTVAHRIRANTVDHESPLFEYLDRLVF